MGNPVVHFEVIGKDAEKLHSYYSDSSAGRSTPTIR